MNAFSFDSLTDDLSGIVASYREFGVVHIRNFFSYEVCDTARSEILRLEDNIATSNSIRLVTECIEDTARIKYFQGLFDTSPAFRKFFDFRLLSLASKLIGKDDVYFADLEAHIRNPGGGVIPMHQDNFYFNLKNGLGLTAYIALSPHSQSSGGLNYKLSSHSKVKNHHPSPVAGFSSYIPHSTGDEDDSSASVYSPDYWIGDISIHHPNNIHWSAACSESAQRGFALSARVFSLSEEIDQSGLERYRKLLDMNRN